MVSIGDRRIWHNGHDSYRENIHMECKGDIIDGYEGWAIIDGERHKVFYKADGNSWVTEEQKKQWGLWDGRQAS